MPERFGGQESFPKEKRYEKFPVIDDGDLAHVPDDLRREAGIKGWTDDLLRKAAVIEFVEDAQLPVEEEARFRSRQEIQQAADAYLELAKTRREIRAEIARLQEAVTQEGEAGVLGLSGLLTPGGFSAQDEIQVLWAQKEQVEADFRKLRDAVRLALKSPTQDAAVELRKDPTAFEDPAKRPERKRVDAKEVAFGLLRRGDALRKARVYEREMSKLEAQAGQTEVIGDLLRLRQAVEDVREGAADAPSASDLLLTHFSEDIDAIVDRLIDRRVVRGFEPGTEEEETARKAVKSHLVDSVLAVPIGVLRKRHEEARRSVAAAEADWNRRLASPMNAELAEFLRDREVESLLRAYHVDKRRFIPVGDIKEHLEDVQSIIDAARGPILRVLLYGPPGTGKTEIFREIGARRKQHVRVISLHEYSSFETLVGTHQIPLPKSETVEDAERFWTRIEGKTEEELAKEIPEAVLAEFNGDTPEAKAKDFRGWFEYKLKTARVAAALGAVSPDDPRVKKAQQEALSAWLDQSLTEGLIEGDLIVLDEVDRAGAGLEGLQDLLTRRPGDLFQPAGRPKPFRIHKDARIGMNANWGDLGTELSGGRGNISSPIASRVLEKRKVDYSDATTEMKLLELMTSSPDGNSHLTATEHDAAKILVEKVFPKLRDMYLMPGERQLLTPISVRTLENVARRLIDETTRSRVTGKDGQPVHFLEAAWAEVSAGPFRADQKDQILSDFAKLFATTGMFNGLRRTGLPLYQLAAKVTGRPESEMASVLAAGSLGTAKMSKGYSLGRSLAGEAPARNDALYGPVRVRSFKAAIRESMADWERHVRELGGTPETQRKFDAMLDAFDAAAETARKEQYDDPTKWASEALAAVETSVRKLPAFGANEIQALVRRLAERYAEADQETITSSGLALSALFNRYFEQPNAAGRALSIDLSAMPYLDFLGYGLKKGTVELRGEVGDYAGMAMEGGTLVAEKVGDKAGFGMRRGMLSLVVAGNQLGQKMRSGTIKVAEAGERLGFKMEGGSIETKVAGDRAGQHAQAGRIVIRGRAGRLLGDEAKAAVKIEFDTAEFVSVRTGADISQNVMGRPRQIMKNGKKLAEPIDLPGGKV